MQQKRPRHWASEIAAQHPINNWKQALRDRADIPSELKALTWAHLKVIGRQQLKRGTP
jgi:hypothetical protein